VGSRVAQLVERGGKNPEVAGSIPVTGVWPAGGRGEIFGSSTVFDGFVYVRKPCAKADTADPCLYPLYAVGQSENCLRFRALGVEETLSSEPPDQPGIEDRSLLASKWACSST
jgi:hypothetical protein